MKLPARRKGDRIVTDTTLIERAKEALEGATQVVSDVKQTEATHTRNPAIDRNCRYWFVEHGDTLLDLAHALIREREAAERLAEACESAFDGIDATGPQEFYLALSAYREAQEETGDE